MHIYFRLEKNQTFLYHYSTFFYYSQCSLATKQGIRKKSAKGDTQKMPLYLYDKRG